MKKLTILMFLCLGITYAQTPDSLKLEKLKDANNLFANGDTVFIKRNDSMVFKIHKEANKIDSLWMLEMVKSPLNDTFQFILNDNELETTELVELPTDLLKKRLADLNAKTPFHIEYNPHLENLIKTYLTRRKATFSKLMDRSRYYFPIFEEQLDKYNIPLEVKYLAIVESALKPRARSRVGATGLWQFMYQTGKLYNLNVSSYVDERSDTYRATEAASQYLSKLYEIFNDWDLALAAYNSGPGNVSKAIRRSGGKKNYWNLRPFLPRETAGYVPAFYATLYIMEYAEEHGIKAKKEALSHFEVDTVQVKRQLTFEQLHKTIGVDIDLLQFLNPQYKLDIIPYVKEKNYTLTLPVNDIGNFLSNEQLIYAYADVQDAQREKPLPKNYNLDQRIHYKVRKGDYLGKIANKYGVSVSKIKRWNNLRSNNLRIGQRLTIYPSRSVAVQTSTKNTKSNSLPKGKPKIYTVKSGDSLWSIAQKFSNVTVQNIKEWNNIWSAKSLKAGSKLKIFN